MNHPARICIAGTALLGLCACGGSKSEAPGTPLPLNTASKVIGAFLLVESNPAAPAALPSWKALPGSAALQLAPGATANACVSTEIVQNPDASTTLKATFTCSSQVDGSTLSGAIWFTFSTATPGNYLFEYKDLKRVKDTQSWTVNGSKQVALDQNRATLRTPTPMTMSFLDTANPAASKTYSYGCNLISDWATTGSYKVWGSFSLQSGNDSTLSGSISELHPLTWNPGCCNPTSGVLTLLQGTASSEVTFALPCGSYSVSGYSGLGTLPACPN